MFLYSKNTANSEEYQVQFQVGTDSVLYIRWKKFQRIFSGRATSVSRTFLEESLENVFYSTFKLDNDDEEKVDRRKVSEIYTHKISSSIAYSSYSLDGSGISKEPSINDITQLLRLLISPSPL